jgi:hypothetical protein
VLESGDGTLLLLLRLLAYSGWGREGRDEVELLLSVDLEGNCTGTRVNSVPCSKGLEASNEEDMICVARGFELGM